jgi:alkylation response protein AidB-like acyl-CoA dehydrogenase
MFGPDDVEAFELWLTAHRPKTLPDSEPDRFAELMRWQQLLYREGWLGWGWPEQYGGRGGGMAERLAIYRCISAADAPLPPTLVGLDVVAPVLVDHGTEAQKERFLRPLIAGEEVWCQGFSEPDAGSDLAALRTTARRRDGGWVLNGQKIWTSTAHHSQWCMVLARSGSGGSRHRGLTMLLVDLATEGVSVAPIELINGDPEFGEVFLDDVWVPDHLVLGEISEGWRIAMATLVYERSVYPARRHAEIRRALTRLVRSVATTPAHAQDASVLRRLGRCETLVAAMGAQSKRAARRLEQHIDSHESSVDKLLLAQSEQAVMGLAIELLGQWSTIERDQATGGPDTKDWLHDYQYARAGSIYGGSAEIQRMIVAESMLGLDRA